MRVHSAARGRVKQCVLPDVMTEPTAYLTHITWKHSASCSDRLEPCVIFKKANRNLFIQKKEITNLSLFLCSQIILIKLNITQRLCKNVQWYKKRSIINKDGCASSAHTAAKIILPFQLLHKYSFNSSGSE